MKPLVGVLVVAAIIVGYLYYKGKSTASSTVTAATAPAPAAAPVSTPAAAPVITPVAAPVIAPVSAPPIAAPGAGLGPVVVPAGPTAYNLSLTGVWGSPTDTIGNTCSSNPNGLLNSYWCIYNNVANGIAACNNMPNCLGYMAAENSAWDTSYSSTNPWPATAVTLVGACPSACSGWNGTYYAKPGNAAAGSCPNPC